MMSSTEEDFELEMRSLPGVLNVGITHRENGDVGGVTLVVYGQDAASIRSVALQIVSLYYPEAVVSVEDVSYSMTPRGEEINRVALVRVDFDTDQGVCEVQLSYGGRVGVGRSKSGPLVGGAEATLAALEDIGFKVPFYLVEVTNVMTVRGWPVIVTLRSLSNEGDRLGIAQSDNEMVGSARATLDALNRFLAAMGQFA